MPFVNLARRFIQSTFNALLNFVYPPLCHLCEAYLHPDEKLICNTCWQSLRRAAPDAQAAGNDFDLDGVYSLWEFGDGVQRIIHEIKFNRKKSLADKVGFELASLVAENQALREVDVIIPLPLHHTRRRIRGYNQSHLLSIPISARAGFPIVEAAVRRVKSTKPQARLSARKRLDNVKGAFMVTDPERVAGKRVLLVDDVVTTGATLNACALALQAAGAGRVVALTVAKA